MKQYSVLLFALVPVAGASLNFPVQRYALTHGFLPLAFTAPRFAIGAALFATFAYFRERPFAISRRDMGTLIAIGVFGIAMNQIALAFALRHCSAATVALLFGTLPVFVAILSVLVHGQRFSVRHWVAAATSTIGVAIVVLGASGNLSADGIGIVFAVLTPLSFGAASVFIRPVLERHSAMRATTVISLAAALPILVFSVHDLSRQRWSSLNGLDWGALAYGGIVSYFVCSLMFFILVKWIGAPKLSLFVNLQPFLGAAFSIALLSEPLGTLQIIGGFVIALAIAVSWGTQPASAQPVQLEA